MAQVPYNTALTRTPSLDALRAGLTGIDHFTSRKGVVFQHDMLEPLSAGHRAIVAKAECIYSEMPWPPGWKVFHQRAETKQRGGWTDYVAAVDRVIEDLQKPSFIVCPKAAAKILATEHPPLPIKINGGDGLLVVRNIHPIEVPDTQALVRALAFVYRSAWDFSCGYGAALHHFRYLIGSDIDRKCLEYIAREYL